MAASMLQSVRAASALSLAATQRTALPRTAHVCARAGTAAVHATPCRAFSSPVQVVLREQIDTLGHAGQLVDVRPGYARNYLYPTGLAVPATPQNLAKYRVELSADDLAANMAVREANRLRARVERTVLQFGRATVDGSNLYAAVKYVSWMTWAVRCTPRWVTSRLPHVMIPCGFE